MKINKILLLVYLLALMELSQSVATPLTTVFPLSSLQLLEKY